MLGRNRQLQPIIAFVFVACARSTNCSDWQAGASSVLAERASTIYLSSHWSLCRRVAARSVPDGVLSGGEESTMKRAMNASSAMARFFTLAGVAASAADTPSLAEAPFNADQAKELQQQWASPARGTKARSCRSTFSSATENSSSGTPLPRPDTGRRPR